MSIFGWFVRAVTNEYERRIKRASEVTEYGLHQHAHNGHASHDDHDAGHAQQPAGQQPAEEEEEEGTVIANVPPGTRV